MLKRALPAIPTVACAAVLSVSGPAWAFGKPRLEVPKVPVEERHSLLHSHNDYEQRHPLFDALSQRFDSVEADVFLVEGKLQVSHTGASVAGTLQDLYLDPLHRIVDRDGSVHGDGKPFYLWIDLKDSNPDLVPVLHEVLSRYPMLTIHTDAQTLEGPVTVILTGDSGNKKRYVKHYSERRATRDADTLSTLDPPADSRWLWYAVDWWRISSSTTPWTGWGPIPPEERTKLNEAVRIAHASGRKLRIYGAPDYETYWNEALAARVDLIGTDRLSELRTFVSTD